MKTIKALLGAALLSALAVTAQENGARGGAQKLTGTPPPAVDTTPANAVVSCGKDITLRLDSGPRGALKQAVLIPARVCPEHQVKFVTTGHGKMKVDRPEYSCRTASVCCVAR